MKWYHTLWAYGLLIWLLWGCHIGMHIPTEALDGSCACADKAEYDARRRRHRRTNISNPFRDITPDWEKENRK